MNNSNGERHKEGGECKPVLTHHLQETKCNNARSHTESSLCHFSKRDWLRPYLGPIETLGQTSRCGLTHFPKPQPTHRYFQPEHRPSERLSPCFRSTHAPASTESVSRLVSLFCS